MEHPEHIKIWARMQEARDQGDMETYSQLREQQIAMLTGRTMPRIDAEEPTTAKESDEIDWDRVARETQTMVDLNREANRRWRESQGSPDDSESEE